MTGFSLHVGIDRLDINHYGSEGILQNPVNDARAMDRLLASRYVPPPNREFLTDANATTADFARVLRDFAARAKPGDIVFVTYSGHGSQIPDPSGLEDDGMDETLCFFDRMMPGAELHGLLALFAEGVRVVFITDACRSGTLVRDLLGPRVEPPPTPRGLKPGDRRWIYGRNRGLYDGLRAGSPQEIAASVITLSACRDDQLASDGFGENGAFTAALLTVWGNGWDRGNYQDLVNAIDAEMKSPSQTPTYHSVTWADPEFETGVPFTV